jgi:hypothetical protein
MRNRIAGNLCLGSLISVAQVRQPEVQQPQQTYSYEPARDGGVREVVEGILIPPGPHAPFTGNAGDRVGQVCCRWCRDDVR